MKSEKVKHAILKLRMVLDLIKDEKDTSGKYLSRLKVTASSLIEQLEKDHSCISDELIDILVKNSEGTVLEFFKTKYNAENYVRLKLADDNLM